jgi:hypothetical protein
MSQQISMFPKKGIPRSLEQDFSLFWLAYPKRSPNPRAMAEKEFAKAVRGGADPAALRHAAAAYAAECAAKGHATDFIVHAATFLRQDRWRDYAPQAAEAAAPSAVPGVDHPLWARCAPHIDLPTFRAWIGRCQVLADTSEELLLSAPSGFVAKRIEAEYAPLLKRLSGCLVVTIDVGM